MTSAYAVGTEVVVTVPATSANLGPGFDALGVALSLRDEVRVRVVGDGDPAVTVNIDGEGAAVLPRDASHLVVRAFHATCSQLGAPPPRIAMTCTNRIPHGRGLGSSAAASVAGVLAARSLLGAGVDDTAALTSASELEGHPDNAAACLLGGLTIAWSEGTSVRAVRVDPAPEVRALVLVPDEALSTQTARGMLPETVPHRDAAHSAGRAALFVEALSRRPDLLLPATEDRLHQRYRAAAMPATAELIARLRGRGLAAVVSGAGPSVLVLVAVADRAQDGLADLADPSGLPPGWRTLELDLSLTGAESSRKS